MKYILVISKGIFTSHITKPKTCVFHLPYMCFENLPTMRSGGKNEVKIENFGTDLYHALFQRPPII